MTASIIGRFQSGGKPKRAQSTVASCMPYLVINTPTESLLCDMWICDDDVSTSTVCKQQVFDEAVHVMGRQHSESWSLNHSVLDTLLQELDQSNGSGVVHCLVSSQRDAAANARFGLALLVWLTTAIKLHPEMMGLHAASIAMEGSFTSCLNAEFA